MFIQSFNTGLLSVLSATDESKSVNEADILPAFIEHNVEYVRQGLYKGTQIHTLD